MYLHEQAAGAGPQEQGPGLLPPTICDRLCVPWPHRSVPSRPPPPLHSQCRCREHFSAERHPRTARCGSQREGGAWCWGCCRGARCCCAPREDVIYDRYTKAISHFQVGSHSRIGMSESVCGAVDCVSSSMDRQRDSTRWMVWPCKQRAYRSVYVRGAGWLLYRVSHALVQRDVGVPRFRVHVDCVDRGFVAAFGVRADCSGVCMCTTSVLMVRWWCNIVE